MIGIKLEGGLKSLFLRGIMTPAGKKNIAKGSILTPDGDKVFWDRSSALAGGLTVTLDPFYAFGGVASGAPVTVGTNVVEASPSGGVAPYTYSWTIDSVGSGVGWYASSSLGASTYFACPDVAYGDTFEAVFKCTVTDARGATGEVTVNAQVSNYGGL